MRSCVDSQCLDAPTHGLLAHSPGTGIADCGQVFLVRAFSPERVAGVLQGQECRLSAGLSLPSCVPTWGLCRNQGTQNGKVAGFCKDSYTLPQTLKHKQ